MTGRSGTLQIGRPSALALLLVGALLVFGGGGSPNRGAEMALSLFAACVAVAWLWTSAGPPHDRRALAWPLVICVLVAALPAMQLIPLPPGAWQALPGRESEWQSLSLIGQEGTWRPLSLAPARTLASLLSLGPPLLALLLVASLDIVQRQRVLVVIAGAMLAAAALGGLQLASGGSAFHFYPESHRGWITGFHANRNAAVDGFLIGGLALAALVAGCSASGRIAARQGAILAGGNLLLMAAAILTGSRMGIALMIPALAGQWFILGPLIVRRRRAATVLALCIAGTTALLLTSNAAITKVASRFEMSRDFRTELWADTRFAIGQVWPAGSGTGTFVPVMLAAERLEVVDPTFPNRAHNDYLELALESGLAGIAIALAVAAVVICMVARAWPDRRGPRRGQIGFALFSLVLVALHSLVDYPLRSMALACLAAVAAGFLAPPPALGPDRKAAGAGSGRMTKGTPL